MLTDTQIAHGSNIAEDQCEKNKILSAKPETILGTLVELSSTNRITIDSESTTFDCVSLKEASMSNEDGQYLHDQAMDTYVKNMVARTHAIMGTVYSEVKPLIAGVKSCIIDKVENSKKNVVDDWTLVVRKYPQVLDNPVLDDILDSCQNNPNASYSKAEIYLARDAIKLILDSGERLCVESNIADISDEIVAMVSAMGGKDYVQKIFTKFYSNPNSSRINIVKPMVSEIEDLLTALFLGRYLRENPPDNVAVSLVDYNGFFDKYCSVLAGSIIYFINVVRSGAVKSKKLVLKIDDDNKTVVVNGDIYDEWLESGGMPDFILGGAVSKMGVGFSNEHDYYERLAVAWRTHLQMRAKLADAKAKEMACLVAYMCFNDYIEGLETDHRFKEIPKETLKACVNECFGFIRTDLSNINDVILSVCDKCLYPNTSVVKFVNLMESESRTAIKRDGELLLSPEEIATYAMMELVISAVAQDITVN